MGQEWKAQKKEFGLKSRDEKEIEKNAADDTAAEIKTLTQLDK